MIRYPSATFGKLHTYASFAECLTRNEQLVSRVLRALDLTIAHRNNWPLLRQEEYIGLLFQTPSMPISLYTEGVRIFRHAKVMILYRHHRPLLIVVALCSPSNNTFGSDYS